MREECVWLRAGPEDNSSGPAPGARNDVIQKRTVEILETVGLADKLGAHPRQLSPWQPLLCLENAVIIPIVL
jgi:hypothetical protein